ncbi:hypothetical protein F5Y14DRAFT_444922 [Nemania sp. NC0429]|nr:hypothetical protein F5Y14DRAFT_444922 [Nemania sp. NC0429]
MPVVPNTPQLSLGQLQEHTYRKSRNVDNTLDDANLETRCPLDNKRHAIQPRHTLMPLFFSCRTLYETLLTTKCATYHHFGGYLYLITCKRVCYSCFTSNINYFPVSSRYAAKQTGLTRKELKRCLPYISSLPGPYTFCDILARNRTLLFDRQSVVESVRPSPSERPRQQLDRRTTEPRRHMSIISAPYLFSFGHSADWGYFCTRCKNSRELSTVFRIKFTKDGIL